MRVWTSLVMALIVTASAGAVERYTLALDRTRPQHHVDWVLDPETKMSHLETCSETHCERQPGLIAVSDLPLVFDYYRHQLFEIAENDFYSITENDLVGVARSLEQGAARLMQAAAAGAGLIGYLKYTGHGASNAHDYVIIFSMLSGIALVAVSTVALVKTISRPDQMAASDLIVLLGEADYSTFQPFSLSPQTYLFFEKTATKVIPAFERFRAGGSLFKKSKKRFKEMKRRLQSKFKVRP